MAVATPPSILCPVLVGRDDALRSLLDAHEASAGGAGGVAAVVGEAGSGKSRLVREVVARVAGEGTQVMVGRAVEGRSPTPYRALTEALLAGLRDRPRPDTPDLQGFEGHLGRLVPAWRTSTTSGADESPVLLAEAVLRLLRACAGDGDVVLVLEDLHWADVETLAVVEYLADALVAERILCLVTARAAGRDDIDGDPLVRLRRHPSATVIELGPLADPQLEALVGAALDDPTPPPAVVDFVTRHSDGNPLLAEELLAGLAGSGALVHDGRWEIAGDLTPTVPRDMAASVHARLVALGPTDRQVLAAASVLGREFDWNLLPAVAEVDAGAVVDSLRAAVDAQVIEVVGREFRFRHALIREAVLAELLPPERRLLSERAWPAIEHAHPGLDGPWCELAAELAEAAGDPDAAAERLVRSAKRALDAAAFATAELTVRRAQQLAVDPAIRLDADECFVEIMTLAGKPSEAVEVGRALDARMAAAGTDPTRRASLLVTLARAGVAAGSLTDAGATIEAARAIVDAHDLDELRAGVDAVAAHVALDRADDATAEPLARSAIERALASGQPAVACEALEVLGRSARTRSTPESRAAFERSAAIAAEHGLTHWLLRAEHELALERTVDGDADALLATRDLAARHGALVSVAVMDLTLADLALGDWDRDAAFAHARACVAASRRYGLATLSVAELWLAGAHALAGDDDEMEAAIERSLARDPDDPRILADVWGRVRAIRSIRQDDRQRLRADLDRMMELADRTPPGQSVFTHRIVWVVLCSIDDDDLGVTAQRRLAALDHLHWFTLLWDTLEIAGAVTLGRSGESVQASERAQRAFDRLRRSQRPSGLIQLLALLVAEAQIRDGWGDPVDLLRPAEAFFAERDHPLVARRCRVALRDAGAPMPRRGRGDSVVPEHLRALGVTGREHDVLLLLVEGRSNREIADALHLSPKTVERHVGSLFDRIGIRNRTDLARWVTTAAN